MIPRKPSRSTDIAPTAYLDFAPGESDEARAEQFLCFAPSQQEGPTRAEVVALILAIRSDERDAIGRSARAKAAEIGARDPTMRRNLLRIARFVRTGSWLSPSVLWD